MPKTPDARLVMQEGGSIPLGDFMLKDRRNF
jgi:hypothetical protein